MDEAMSTIAGGTGATGAALAGLGEDFTAVFGKVPQSADIVASALADMNTATGATGAELQGLVRNVLDASRALGESEVPALAFGRALEQFEVPAAQGAAVLDKLLVISQNSGVGLSDLINKTTTYGSVLKNAGFSIEETAGFFGQLEKGGIAVSRVMPGLNASFRRWAEAGLDTRDMLEKTVGLMKTATTDTAALNIATEAFGAEGAQRMTTAVRSGILVLEDLTKGLAASEGAVRNAGAATLTFSDKLAGLKNKATLALAPVGVQLLDAVERLIPVLERGLGWVARLAEGFGNLSPFVQKVILVVGGLTAALGPVLLAIGPLLPMIGGLVTAAGGLSGILGGLWTAFAVLTGPIGLTVAAVVGLGAIWLKWGDDIKRIVASTFSVVRDWMVGKFGAIVESIRGKIDAVTGFFRGMWEKVVGNSYIPDMVDQIGSNIARLDDLMVNKVRAQVGETTALFSKVADAAQQAVDVSARVLTPQPVAVGGGSPGGPRGGGFDFHDGDFTLRPTRPGVASAFTGLRSTGGGTSTVINNYITQNSLVNSPQAKDELRRMMNEVMTDGQRAQGVRLQTV